VCQKFVDSSRAYISFDKQVPSTTHRNYWLD